MAGKPRIKIVSSGQLQLDPIGPVSVTQFKAFLKGMDMLKGGSDWCPDASQWARIRQHIEHLEELGNGYMPPQGTWSREYTPGTVIPQGQGFRPPEPQFQPSSFGDSGLDQQPANRIINPSSLPVAFSGKAPAGILPGASSQEFL